MPRLVGPHDGFMTNDQAVSEMTLWDLYMQALLPVLAVNNHPGWDENAITNMAARLADAALLYREKHVTTQ